MIINISFIMETFMGQLLALITFFAFPAIQYFFFKKILRKSGRPELWYLPDYGFRLVIRNIPYKKNLSDIKTKIYLRRKINPSAGSTVSTLEDEILLEREDMFLISGLDQILISFKIEGEIENKLKFIQTDKIGHTVKEVGLSGFNILVCDYTANVENFLNFDVKIAKRVTIKPKDFKDYWHSIKENNNEKSFKLNSIVDVE